MTRYIDADALANYANNQVGGITANAIMRFPSADVETVRHGHWKLDEIIGGMQDYKCSVCGGVISETFMMQYRFCPWCGAKMVGGEENSEE